MAHVWQNTSRLFVLFPHACYTFWKIIGAQTITMRTLWAFYRVFWCNWRWILRKHPILGGNCRNIDNYRHYISTWTMPDKRNKATLATKHPKPTIWVSKQAKSGHFRHFWGILPVFSATLTAILTLFGLFWTIKTTIWPQNAKMGDTLKVPPILTYTSAVLVFVV